VGGARVFLFRGDDDPEYHAITDEQGRFLFADLAAGDYKLSASRQGFVETGAVIRRIESTDGERPGEPVTLRSGERRTGFELRMTPAGVISGRVLDALGEPVAGIAMAPARITYSGRRRTMTGMGRHSVATSFVFTNDRGEYRLYGLLPGRYYVVAMGIAEVVQDVADMGSGGEARTVKQTDEGPRDVLGVQYYPGVPDPANAVALEVGAGEEKSGINLIYDYVPLVQARGRITIPASCRGNISVVAKREIGGQRNALQAAIDEGGRFELRGLTPGVWRVSAAQSERIGLFGNGRGCSTGEVAVQVGLGGADGVSLVMRPEVELSGVARFESDAGMPLERIRITAESMESDDGTGTEIKKDGRFTLTLNAGKWSLGAESLPPDAFVKSARIGNQDVLETGLDLYSGPLAGGLEIVIGLEGAHVEGVVVDASGKPAQAATVTLIPESRLRDHGRLFQTTVTGKDGRFALSGIAPGSYKLFAWEAMEGEAYRDPDFLRPYESRGEAVEVHGKETIPASLRLIVR
jgi:hypothetical protein